MLFVSVIFTTCEHIARFPYLSLSSNIYFCGVLRSDFIPSVSLIWPRTLIGRSCIAQRSS